MKSKLLVFLTVLFASLTGFGGSTMTPDVSDLPGVITQVSNLTVEVASKVASNDLSRTTLGNEGIRRVGAIGGYTLEEFIEDTANRGAARDLSIFAPSISNLNISWSGGDVYEPIMGYFHLDPGSRTLTDNANNFAYWRTNDTTLVQWTTGVRPVAEGNIYLGTFVTVFGKIIHDDRAAAVGDELLSEDAAFANIMPSIITEGITVTPNGTGLTNITLNGGIEYHNMADRINHDSFNFATSNRLVLYCHTNSTWAQLTTNLFPIGKWDNGTNLVATDPAKWYRGLFLSIANSGQLTYVAPDSEYTNSDSAIAGNDPDRPPGFDPYIPLSTAYVFAGNDTELRNDITYWLDRRFMIRRGNISGGGGGGSANVPTLGQVLVAGAGTGGILPTGMGLPTTDDEAASKEYVDSTANKASTGTAFVDAINGDDIQGRIQKFSLPFKTIQAAIDACALVATDDNRFLVEVGIGKYYENITMHSDISLKGSDIEGTFIYGTVTWPSTYDDITGTEIQLISVSSSNAPAAVIDISSEDAYVGIRACALYSMWDNNAPVKSVVNFSRGNIEIYSTTWTELDIYPTNSLDITTNIATLFYGTTDPINSGAYEADDFDGSHVIRCTDSNDIICVRYSDATNINSSFATKNAKTEIFLNSMTNNVNKVIMQYHNGANDSSYAQATMANIRLSVSNQCPVMMGLSKNASIFNRGNGIHALATRMRVPNINGGNSFIGGAVTTNDYIEIFNSAIASQTATYPIKYTLEGSSGTVSYVIQHNNGDILLSGGIDFSNDGGLAGTPQVGHIKLFNQTTAGLEQPYFKDSSGANYRIIRDLLFTGHNEETNTLLQGELVYLSTNVVSTAHSVRRAFSTTNLITRPAFGIVCNVGGIAPNVDGRCLKYGRTEFAFDTSMFAKGDPLYVPMVGVNSFPTNVAPTGTNIVQQIGFVNRVGTTNGSITIHAYHPDVLGGLVSSYYAAQGDLTNEIANRLAGDTAVSNAFGSADTVISNAYVAADTVISNAFGSADTAMSNSLVSVMNAKDTIISNAFGTADTAMSNSLVGVMNSKDTVISNAYVAADTVVSNAFGAADTTMSNSLVSVMDSKDTVIFNAFGSADTTLSNSLVGVMNAKDTIVSNAFGTADTAMSNSLVSVMDSKDTVIFNAFGSADTTLSNSLIGVMNSMDTVVSNSIGTYGITLSNSLVGVMNTKDTVISNAFVAADAVITNNIAQYHIAKRFKAAVSYTANITYGSGLSLTPFTNVVLAASGGSIYSNALTICQWWPKATNGIIRFQGSWNAASANSATYLIHIYKNGAKLADVYDWSNIVNLGNNSMGSTWSFVDTRTPTLNDYYQVYTTFNSTRSSVGNGTNNWWYGEVTTY